MTDAPPIAGEPVAPHPINDAPAPRRVFRLETDDTNGSIAVARGRPTAGRTAGAPAGTGTGDAGGAGPHDAAGTGRRPVSIAALKKKAMPIGDTGFIGNFKDYPPQAKHLGIEGVVKVKVVVDQHGRVASANVIAGLGHGLDQKAVQLAKDLRFSPALDTADRPVASVVVWTFHFTLPD